MQGQGHYRNMKVKKRFNDHFTKSFLGSGSFLNIGDTDDERDYKDESDINDGKSDNNAEEDYSEKDKISITNFVNKKVAVIEPLKAALPMFARSRSLKQHTLPKYGENRTEKIQENQDMKTLENEQVDKSPVLPITPKQLTPTTTDSNLQSKMELTKIMYLFISCFRACRSF